jgi:predicted kinase
VRAYRETGGDPGEDALIAFYATYRALVRAKVALVRASQNSPTTAAHGHQSAAARDLIAVAERFAWQARLPLVIVVCGVPASGKSYLARALAAAAGLPHLSSDVTRKRLAGLAATQRAPIESYSAEWNARTYAELGRRAAETVTRCGGAIVDATFRHVADRLSYASAFPAAPPTLFVECQAPREVLAQRAARREQDPERVSDADTSVVLREHTAWEPLDEVPVGAHLVVRTDRPAPQILAELMALIDRRLFQLADDYQ